MIVDYGSNSLCLMQTPIDRYLRERGYTHSILKSREFASPICDPLYFVDYVIN